MKNSFLNFSPKFFFRLSDMCFLSDNIYDYYNVSQGKVTVPNMDDGEEFTLTDVSSKKKINNTQDYHTTTPLQTPLSKHLLHHTHRHNSTRISLFLPQLSLQFTLDWLVCRNYVCFSLLFCVGMCPEILIRLCWFHERNQVASVYGFQAHPFVCVNPKVFWIIFFSFSKITRDSSNVIETVTKKYPTPNKRMC